MFRSNSSPLSSKFKYTRYETWIHQAAGSKTEIFRMNFHYFIHQKRHRCPSWKITQECSLPREIFIFFISFNVLNSVALLREQYLSKWFGKAREKHYTLKDEMLLATRLFLFRTIECCNISRTVLGTSWREALSSVQGAPQSAHRV
jgi:hypothetical protein